MTSTAENFDPKELAKFEILASRWWDTDSEFKPLHDINPLRLDFIQQHANLSQQQVLDVGCGGGILSESMAAVGGKVTGIDLGEAPLSVARLHQLESGLAVDYQNIAVEKLAESQPESFDVITCMEMLEHVPEPSSIIQACAKLLKPNGHVFFSTINRNLKSFMFAIVGAEYALRLLPKGTHEYAKFIKPGELDSWARAADLSLGGRTGMTYNPLSRQYKLANDLDVNYILHYQKY